MEIKLQNVCGYITFCFNKDTYDTVAFIQNQLIKDLENFFEKEGFNCQYHDSDIWVEDE